jgi:xanthine/uracil permease
MENKTSISFGGILVPGLQILFVFLKLTERIDWSWFWVLSPLIFGAMFTVGILLVVLIVFIVTAIVSG